MGIEFGPIAGLDFFKLTRLQSEWEDRYPNMSEQPGIPPAPPMGEGMPMMQFMIGEPPRRIWAAGSDNGLLIQTQGDRLILNWRKSETTQPYPGYSTSLRNEYSQLWATFKAFLERTGTPLPVPVISEFTYVNSVPLAESDSLHDVLTLVSAPTDEVPGRDTFGRFQFIREVSESATDPFSAQIQISGEPQMGENGRQLAFTVVARVILGARWNEPLAGLDAAHSLASHTFSRIVTRAKQEQWGRIQ